MDVETTMPARPKVNGRMWQPGQSGNPAGRPIGARGRFSERFIADLTDAWQEYGATALARTAKEYPDRFVGIASHLIPNDVALTVSQNYAGLDQTDMALLKALRIELPNADSMTPTEAFEYAREALRAAQANPLVLEHQKHDTDK